MNRHLTNDELLDRVYDLAEMQGPSNGHLRECLECAARFHEFERRWAETASSPASSEVSSEFLAAQRRRIYARLEEPSRVDARWAPALAAAFLLALGALLYQPGYRAPVPVPSPPELTDEQLFSDVYSMVQSAEPRAAAPIHALFETPEGEEE